MIDSTSFALHGVFNNLYRVKVRSHIRCAALRCKCMLLLNTACDELCCAALLLHAGVFTHTLRCAALLNAAYDELRCAALRCAALLFEAASKKSCFEAAFEAALLLKFSGFELHSADWLLKVCY